MILTELKNIKTEKKNLRQFALLWFAILFGLGLWKLYQGEGGGSLFCGLGAVIGSIGWLRPFLFKPLYLVWMGIAVVLGNIVSRLILVFTFYLVITPMGFLFRLFGKSFMKPKGSASYWVTRDDFSSTSEKYERQF